MYLPLLFSFITSANFIVHVCVGNPGKEAVPNLNFIAFSAANGVDTQKNTLMAKDRIQIIVTVFLFIFLFSFFSFLRTAQTGSSRYPEIKKYDALPSPPFRISYLSTVQQALKRIFFKNGIEQQNWKIIKIFFGIKKGICDFES